MQDTGGQGVGEVVEGEGEEAENFLVLLLSAGHREQVVRGTGCVDWGGDVMKVFALVAGLHPFWEMGVDVRHHEFHPSSSPLISIPIRMPIRPRVPIPYEYIPTITQFLESFVNLPLYIRRGTASARAEIDECVVSNGRPEDGLKRAGNEGGGRRRLEDWSFVFPQKSETRLDEGAEGSRNPRNGSVVLVF